MRYHSRRYVKPSWQAVSHVMVGAKAWDHHFMDLDGAHARKLVCWMTAVLARRRPHSGDTQQCSISTPLPEWFYTLFASSLQHISRCHVDSQSSSFCRITADHLFSWWSIMPTVECGERDMPRQYIWSLPSLRHIYFFRHCETYCDWKRYEKRIWRLHGPFGISTCSSYYSTSWGYSGFWKSRVSRFSAYHHRRRLAGAYDTFLCNQNICEGVRHKKIPLGWL